MGILEVVVQRLRFFEHKVRCFAFEPYRRLPTPGCSYRVNTGILRGFNIAYGIANHPGGGGLCTVRFKCVDNVFGFTAVG